MISGVPGLHTLNGGVQGGGQDAGIENDLLVGVPRFHDKLCVVSDKTTARAGVSRVCGGHQVHDLEASCRAQENLGGVLKIGIRASGLDLGPVSFDR